MQKTIEVIRRFIDVPSSLCFCQVDGINFCRIFEQKIEYTSKREALRGLGLYLAGERGEFRCDFETLGIMLDCSRNAVPKISWLKHQILGLSLLGYNHVELYMEDTYQCPGEPFFGYGRGAYSMEELKEVDDFGNLLGVEVCAAIQCLGHMEQILKFDDYSDIADTPRILMVDEDKTYKLIEKMIAFQSEAFHSRRINIGFDEAIGLGQGKYLEKYGYENTFEIFIRHLKRVIEICEKYHMKPMIWSDMFFRSNNKEHLYYVSKLEINDALQMQIPKNLQLVFWDYYHWEDSYYLDMIKIHRDLGFEPVVASMIWTPARMWYDHIQTSKTVCSCISSSKIAGIKELIFTLWGDDGAYCDFDSAMAGLTFASSKIWNCSETSLQKQYEICFGGNYNLVLLASEMTVPFPGQFTAGVTAAEIIWDDPILGVDYRNIQIRYKEALNIMHISCSNISKKLNGEKTESGGDVEHAFNICALLPVKIALRQRMEAKIFDAETCHLAEKARVLTEALIVSFRVQWERRNKLFGMNLIQTRLAGLAVRFEEIKRRIENHQDFPELDLPYPEKVISGESWHKINLIPM